MIMILERINRILISTTCCSTSPFSSYADRASTLHVTAIDWVLLHRHR